MEKDRRGLLAARVGFGIVLVMVVPPHFLPSWSGENFTLCDLWEDLANDMDVMIAGHWSVDRAMGVATVGFVTVTLIAAPFVAGFFQRAPALLWVMRLLALAFSGWFTVMIWRAARNFESPQVQLQKIGPGLWLLMGAFWIFALAWFLIRPDKTGAVLNPPTSPSPAAPSE